MYEFRQCPTCKENSMVDLPIGLSPTKEQHGNIYANSVCHNNECGYRELNFIQKIPSEEEEKGEE